MCDHHLLHSMDNFIYVRAHYVLINNFICVFFSWDINL